MRDDEDEIFEPQIPPESASPVLELDPPTQPPGGWSSRTPPIRWAEVGVPNPVAASPSASLSLVQMIRPNAAMILLGATFLLGLIEIIASVLAYRERVRPEHWQEVQAVLDSKDPAPLLIAGSWLGPRARMELESARQWNSVAPADLRGVPRFWVLGYGDPWTPELAAELEGLPTPDLVGFHRIGELVLHEYEQADAGIELWSLLDREIRVESSAGRCSGNAGRWTCKDGKIRARPVEIDYRPRRCLAATLDEASTLRLALGEVELGNRLRGHVGFGDFNARLRADPAAMVEVEIDGAVKGRWLFSDDQGWAAFALATTPGTHEVVIAIEVSVAGTWQDGEHRPVPSGLLCLEARAFVESEAAT